jgi:membrane associated rhomboid family serine protease
MLANVPRATRAILIANVVVYLLQLSLGEGFTERFALWPLGTHFAPHQIFTYAFLHDPRSFAHIFFNMFAVFMFGSRLEHYFGTSRYIVFYVASLLAAACAQLVVAYATGSVYYVVGASGAVFGLLLAFAMFFPRERLMLLFPPIPMPAWLFVTLYGVLELTLGVTRSQDQIAHFAHLGGMLGGALVILFWRLQGAPRRPRF